MFAKPAVGISIGISSLALVWTMHPHRLYHLDPVLTREQGLSVLSFGRGPRAKRILVRTDSDSVVTLSLPGGERSFSLHPSALSDRTGVRAGTARPSGFKSRARDPDRD